MVARCITVTFSTPLLCVPRAGHAGYRHVRCSDLCNSYNCHRKVEMQEACEKLTRLNKLRSVCLFYYFVVV